MSSAPEISVDPVDRGESSTQVDMAAFVASRQSLDQQIARLQRQTRLAIEQHLRPFAGQTRTSLAENRRWVNEITALIDSQGLRVRCPECGHASILRVSPRRGSSGGVFVFDHTIDRRRTFHGGSGRLPVIRLMAKPRRQSGKGV